MRYLAIDYGGKRTGLAVCDANETIASPAGMLYGQNKLIERIVEVIEEKAMMHIEAVDDENKRKIELLKKGEEFEPGIIKIIKVLIAQNRKISVGDKMAGRHGNKGCVAKILPIEDMPFLEDGSPIDIVLNPLGVPSRMNVGQLYELILGWAGLKMGKHYETHVFDGATQEDVEKHMETAGRFIDKVAIVTGAGNGIGYGPVV